MVSHAQIVYGGISRLRRGDAASVTKNTVKTFRKYGVTPTKLTNYTSDGCAVYTGKISGVVTRLSWLWSLLIAVHCICHRLALAALTAAKSVVYYQKFFDLVEFLGRHYDYSVKRTASLAETMVSMGQSALKLVKSAFTRWLSHDNVTSAIHKRLPAILFDLKTRAEGDDGDRAPAVGEWTRVGKPDMKALGVYTAMNTVEYVTALTVIRDTVPLLAELNKKLQSQDTDIECITVDIPRVISEIEAQLDNPGHNYMSRKKLLAEVAEALGIDRVPRGHNRYTDEWEENQRRKYIKNLVAELKERFKDAPVLVALHKLFTLAKHPPAKSTAVEIAAHFKADLANLIPRVTRWVLEEVPDDVELTAPEAPFVPGSPDPNANKVGYVQVLTEALIRDQLYGFVEAFDKAVREAAPAYLKRRNDDLAAKKAAWVDKYKKKHNGKQPQPHEVPAHLSRGIENVPMAECIRIFFSGQRSRKVDNPTFFFLSEVAIVMFMNSADPERAFSAMKVIKNELRNKLGAAHLVSLMEMYFNLGDRHLQGLTGDEKTAAEARQIKLDNVSALKAVMHWNRHRSHRVGPFLAPALTASWTAAVESGDVSESFKTDLSEMTDFEFGSSAADIDALAESGELKALAGRREANRAKRDVQPVPSATCTRDAATMDRRDREPVFDHIKRFAWGELGEMTPQVNDAVAHWWNDLGTNKEEKVPGWADGVITKLNPDGKTFDVLYSDGLIGDKQALDLKDYGEDNVWVILKTTVDDPLEPVPLRQGTVTSASDSDDDDVIIFS